MEQWLRRHPLRHVKRTLRVLLHLYLHAPSLWRRG